MTYCFTCGNKGLLDKVCPECGHPKIGDVSTKLETMSKFNDIKAAISVPVISKNALTIIPESYNGIFWSKRKLENYNSDKLPEKFDIPDKKNDRLFERFLNNLTKIDNIFSSGGIPNKSIYIIAPPGYSKTIFAYSCMQNALASGYTVAPLIDSIELKRLLILASEKADYKLYGSIGYDEYITKDVVFITVTHTYYRYDAYSSLEEIINRRARLGLSTFIISRYSLSTLYKWDKFNTLDSLKFSESKDTNKYPAVVMYSERMYKSDSDATYSQK